MVSNSKSLQDYVFISKYARTINGKKETWEQAVERVLSMHKDFLSVRYGVDMEKLKPFLEFAESKYLNQDVLGAPRALQWGGNELLKHHFRSYNCAASYANRVDFFSELYYVLLTGAGVGYSVQKHHVDMIPKVEGYQKDKKEVFVVPDKIEGWADSMKKLLHSFFYYLPDVEFDLSEIRPKGAFISGGFKAPGPNPLKKSLDLVKDILKGAIGRKLTTLEVHRMACIIADSVVSGGVRRSALISIFSEDDEDMIKCKTGNWFNTMPYLGRANNSVVILPETPYSVYANIFEATKQFGEPGIVFLPDREILVNPCCEIGLYPTWIKDNGDKEYGFAVCNLTEINGRNVTSKQKFIDAGIAASTLGTIQASYTDFPYLGEVTEKIVRRDSLIGVGITGMAENPDILFNPETQREVAKVIKSTNKKVAKIIGINYAARTTTIKPSGTSSSLLGTSSGIHPFHSKRFIRHVQVNKQEQAGIVMKDINPVAVRDSVWSSLDSVIAFPIEKDDTVITKSKQSAIQFLELVKLTQQNWIEEGTNWDHPSYKVTPKFTHNVSNTVNVLPNEWDEVMEYLWENKDSFCGISMLPASGDLDYPQAPFTEVLDEVELAKTYGPAAILAGGLNIDGIHAFGDLWKAIDTALGRGEKLSLDPKDISNLIASNTTITPEGSKFLYKIEGVLVSDVNAILGHLEEKLSKKKDWVRRFNKFSKKYLNNDLERTGYCLKHVSIFHYWQQLNSIKKINWEDIEWEEQFKDAGADTAASCYGGVCEITI